MRFKFKKRYKLVIRDQVIEQLRKIIMKIKKRYIVFGVLVIGLVWVSYKMWGMGRRDILESQVNSDGVLRSSPVGEFPQDDPTSPEATLGAGVDNYDQKMLGQMFIVGIEGEGLTEEEKFWLEEGKIGGVILLSKNIDNEEQLYNLTEEINKTATVSGMIPLISVDQEGGVVSRIDFVDKTAQIEIKDSFEALKVSIARSQKLKDLGINVNLAPVIESRGEVGSFSYNQSRSFTDNDYLLPETMIKGCKEVGITCVAKHFPGGLSRVKVDPHMSLPVINLTKEEIKDDLSRFEKIVESGVEAIMVTHIDYPLIDSENISSASRVFIEEILRKERGFDGLVFIDDIAMGAVKDRYEMVNFVIKAIEASADQLIISDQRIYQEIWEEVENRVGESEELQNRVKESGMRRGEATSYK